jgi:hypothetical protein
LEPIGTIIVNTTEGIATFFVTAQVARKISLFRLLKTAELCDKGEHEIIA